MDKKILFVMHSGNVGGSTSSLINMIEVLHNVNINADIFLMSHVGPYLEDFQKFSLLKEDKILASSICNKKDFQKRYGLTGIFIRFLIKIENLLKLNIVKKIVFKASAKRICGYDIVVAYQETLVTDFVRYINCKKKFAWVHSIFQKFSCHYRNKAEMYSAYRTFYKIICVAEKAANYFSEGLPDLKDKVLVIPNPLNSLRIVELSMKESMLSDTCFWEDNAFKIVSVGRLSQEKQFDLAIKAAHTIKKAGKKFKWLILGDGSQREYLQQLIDDLDINEHIILTGAVRNPYPIIKKADLLVITSSYEAQPMVANEALILGTPVITTNYPTAYALIKNGVNGIICDNSCDSISSVLLEIMDNKSLMVALNKGASLFSYDTSFVVNKIKDLFFGEE